MQQAENWERLKAAARRAGIAVDDDGASVQFSQGRARAACVKNTRGKVTGYQVAVEWLRRKGVTGI
jgi:hypothetical protein